MDGAEYPQRASGKAIGAPGNHGGRLLEPPHCAGGAGWNSGASIGSTVGDSYASADPGSCSYSRSEGLASPLAV